MTSVYSVTHSIVPTTPSSNASTAQNAVDTASSKITGITTAITTLSEALATIQEAIAILEAELGALVAPNPDDYLKTEVRLEGSPPHPVTVVVRDTAAFNRAMSEYLQKVQQLEGQIQTKQTELAQKETELAAKQNELNTAKAELDRAQRELERALSNDRAALLEAQEAYRRDCERIAAANKQALEAQAQTQKAQDDLKRVEEQTERMTQAAMKLAGYDEKKSSEVSEQLKTWDPSSTTPPPYNAPENLDPVKLTQYNTETDQAKSLALLGLASAKNHLPRLDGETLLAPVSSLTTQDYIELTPKLASIEDGITSQEVGLLANLAGNGADEVGSAAILHMVETWTEAGFKADQIKTLLLSAGVLPSNVADADYVASAANADEATRRLEILVQLNPSSEYRQQLGADLALRFDPLHPSNADVDDVAKRWDIIAAAVVNVTEKGGADTAADFARGFASTVNDEEQYNAGVVMGDRFAGALEKIMTDTGSIRFGLALTSELAKAGELQSAGAVDTVVGYAMYATQSRFNELNSEIDKLNEDLAASLGPVGGALTDEQRQKAIAAFQAEHQSTYDAWEKAGAQYAQMLEAIGEADRSAWSDETRFRAEGFVKDLPTLARTQAGMEFLADEIEKQGVSHPSFMDVVSDMGEQGKLEKELLENMSIAVARATGMRVLNYAQSGSIDAASGLLEGLRRNARLFGVDESSMTGIVDTLGSLHPDMTAEELAAFTTRYNDNLDKVFAAGVNPKGGAVQALRAIGILFGAAYCINGIATEKDIALKTQYLADALGMGADVGLTVVQAVQASGRFADEASRVGGWMNVSGDVFRVGGALMGGISAIVDGISAARAFHDGKPIEGAASAQMALGGLLMTAASLNAIPGWGQLAGAVLLFSGLVTSVVADKVEDDRIKNMRRELLTAAGLPKDVVDTLCDANFDRMAELTNEMKLSPEQIMELVTKYPGIITQGEHNGVSVDGIRSLQKASDMTNDELMDLIRCVGSGPEADRCIAMLLGNTMPQQVRSADTLDEWLTVAEENIKTGGDDEYVRVWTEIRAALLREQATT